MLQSIRYLSTHIYNTGAPAYNAKIVATQQKIYVSIVQFQKK